MSFKVISWCDHCGKVTEQLTNLRLLEKKAGSADSEALLQKGQCCDDCYVKVTLTFGELVTRFDAPINEVQER